MIEQLGNAIVFYAFYTASKVGKAGLSVSVTVYEGTTGTPIVSGAGATELGSGLYYYTLAAGAVDAVGEYAAVFHTADASVDQQDIPALWSIGRAGIENLDAPISGLPSAATIAAAVWAYSTRTITSIAVLAGDIAAAVWAYTVRTLTMTAAQVEDTLEGDDLTLYTHDGLSATWTGLPDFTGYSKVWFTIKADGGLADSDAEVFTLVTTPADLNDGLQYVARAIAPNKAHSSITVVSSTSVRVMLKAAAAAYLTPGRYLYEIKALITGDDAQILTQGDCTIVWGRVKAVS